MSYQNRQLFINRAFAVKEYAYNENINNQFRFNMEDEYFIIDNFQGKNQILFGIFDGHGGDYCSKYLQQQFYQEFSKNILNNEKDINKCMQLTFQNLDKQLNNKQGQSCGSTGCVGFIRFEDCQFQQLLARRILYIANVGDSRAVLVNDSQSTRLSYDHKATDLKEQLRIQQKGGFIMNGRLEGILAITKSFGDFYLKNKGLSVDPFIKRVELRIINKYIIIASDGIWDIIEDQEIPLLIYNLSETNQITQTLIKTAIQRGSQDNISIIALKIN